MYSIDINLLRERTGESVTQGDFTSGTTSSMAPRAANKIPMLLGMGVGALALLATGGTWFFTNDPTAKLEAKQKDLDTTLGNLKAKESRLQALNAQYAQASDETNSLASVFNQIQPWSAILQDLRENIPQGVKIDSISQTEEKATAAAAPATPAPSGGLVNKISTPPNPEAKPTPSASPAAGATAATTPAATPAAPTPVAATAPTPVAATAATAIPAEIPTTKVAITGTAKNFDEVNNFVLTLKQSAFFNPDDTRLVTASLTPSTIEWSKGTNPPQPSKASPNEAAKLEMPKVVAYSIQTSIKRVPANALMQELERKGAVGLVARLRLLQQQQVIKP